MRTILTGKPITSEEALSWGLLCELMEDGVLLQQTIVAATALTTHGSEALELAKEAICRGENQSLLRRVFDQVLYGTDFYFFFFLASSFLPCFRLESPSTCVKLMVLSPAFQPTAYAETTYLNDSCTTPRLARKRSGRVWMSSWPSGAVNSARNNEGLRLSGVAG